jgi:hypothetical protein
MMKYKRPESLPTFKNKRADLSANPLFVFGGAEGDRTPDPKTASLVLSQLSYSPIFCALRGVKFNITAR